MAHDTDTWGGRSDSRVRAASARPVTVRDEIQDSVSAHAFQDRPRRRRTRRDATRCSSPRLSRTSTALRDGQGLYKDDVVGANGRVERLNVSRVKKGTAFHLDNVRSTTTWTGPSSSPRASIRPHAAGDTASGLKTDRDPWRRCRRSHPCCGAPFRAPAGSPGRGAGRAGARERTRGLRLRQRTPLEGPDRGRQQLTNAVFSELEGEPAVVARLVEPVENPAAGERRRP